MSERCSRSYSSAWARHQGISKGWEESDHPTGVRPGRRVANGPQLRQREDGREGRILPLGKGCKGHEEGGSGLSSDAGGDGQEALQRGILSAGPSPGGGSILGVGRDDQRSGYAGLFQTRSFSRIAKLYILKTLYNI